MPLCGDQQSQALLEVSVRQVSNLQTETESVTVYYAILNIQLKKIYQLI